MRRLLISAAMVVGIVGVGWGQEAAKTMSMAPSADTAPGVLKDSPRHGEWVEVPMGDVKIKTWVVYPERKEKAPVVIVIHEIFGLSDWVRSVADQLASEGFIAVAPDLISGYGPNRRSPLASSIAAFPDLPRAIVDPG